MGIDLGIKTGIALLSVNARLIWYRSHNFGNRTRLRKGIYTILSDIVTQGELQFLIMEGSRDIGKLWIKMSQKFHVPAYFVSPEKWRKKILNITDLNSYEAKKQAKKIAKEIIKKSGLPMPKDINHNAAEAILICLWGVINYNEKNILQELNNPQ